jgi:DNA-directed RNA polymerase subunit RPC12/RpoP
MTERKFSFGGLGNASGALGAAIPTGKIVIPGGAMDVKGNRLLWAFDFDQVKEVSPPDTLLDHFVQLWEGDDAAILRFARKWGPLRIDKRGNLLWSNRNALSGKSWDKFPKSGSDSLDAWRFFSQRAYSVLRIAAALYRDSRGDIADWKYLSSEAGGRRDEFFGMGDWIIQGMLPNGIPFPNVNTIPLPVDRLRNQIAGELSNWVSRYEVALRVVWKETPQIELSYGGHLLSAVALQLALSVLREHSVYTCSGCGRPYSRGSRKRPKTGDANFCEECGRTEALRQAQERRRKKINNARALHLSGTPTKKIALDLNSSIETVKKWIGEE